MSDIRELCRKIYRETVEAADINTELKRSLRTHERVPVFIDNLAAQFKGLRFTVKRDSIEKAVRDLTWWFIKAAERKAHENLMSDMEKLMIKAKEQAKEDFRREAEALEKKGAESVIEENGFETQRQTVRF